MTVDVQCCDQTGELYVLGIDLEHRVFLADDLRLMMWVPGKDPIPVTGLPADGINGLPQQWPRGVTYEDGTVGAPYGTVDVDGRFQSRGTAPTGQLGLWSPDGATYVYPKDGRLFALAVQGKAPVPLPLPDSGWLQAGWESRSVILLLKRGDPVGDLGLPSVTGLVRCDVEAMVCAELTDVPSGGVAWPTVGTW